MVNGFVSPSYKHGLTYVQKKETDVFTIAGLTCFAVTWRGRKPIRGLTFFGVIPLLVESGAALV